MTEYKEIYARREQPGYKALSSVRNKDINKFKINTNNAFIHELVKFIIFYKLRKLEHDIVVEAIFSNGKRADLLDLNTNIIYEVLNTEKKENIDLKQAKYPCKIIPIYCSDLNFVGSTNSLLNSFEKQLEE